jgi:hypothetical protein
MVFLPRVKIYGDSIHSRKCPLTVLVGKVENIYGKESGSDDG